MIRLGTGFVILYVCFPHESRNLRLLLCVYRGIPNHVSVQFTISNIMSPLILAIPGNPHIAHGSFVHHQLSIEIIVLCLHDSPLALPRC
jgi:hypothetical protein